MSTQLNRESGRKKLGLFGQMQENGQSKERIAQNIAALPEGPLKEHFIELCLEALPPDERKTLEQQLRKGS